MTANHRHASACSRANIAALEYAEALETGNRYAQEVAYLDFKQAYDEANTEFLASVKAVMGISK